MSNGAVARKRLDPMDSQNDQVSLSDPEVNDRLQHYLALLLKWQDTINLVGPGTVSTAWERHFLDSLRLLGHIPLEPSSRRKPGTSCSTAEVPGLRRDDGIEGVGRTVLFDFGSGAGFPGLVLAIARPDLDVTLIESDRKKCTFLSTVSRETKTKTIVLNQRIELVKTDIVPDFITARALASVDKLLAYCLPFARRNPDLKMLFLKGEKAEDELALAHLGYRFDARLFPGGAEQGCVLHVTNLAER